MKCETINVEGEEKRGDSPDPVPIKAGPIDWVKENPIPVVGVLGLGAVAWHKTENK